MNFYCIDDDMMINMDYVEYVCTVENRIYFHMRDDRDYFRKFKSAGEAEEEFYEISEKLGAVD